jgi:hypothetical protein
MGGGGGKMGSGKEFPCFLCLAIPLSLSQSLSYADSLFVVSVPVCAYTLCF